MSGTLIKIWSANQEPTFPQPERLRQNSQRPEKCASTQNQFEFPRCMVDFSFLPTCLRIVALGTQHSQASSHLAFRYWCTNLLRPKSLQLGLVDVRKFRALADKLVQLLRCQSGKSYKVTSECYQRRHGSESQEMKIMLRRNTKSNVHRTDNKARRPCQHNSSTMHITLIDFVCHSNRQHTAFVTTLYPGL